jgi:hypothetical protein
MLVQRLAFELNEDIDSKNSAVDEVGESEIDDTVFGPEINGGLGSVTGQRHQSLALAARENDSENSPKFPSVHGYPPFPIQRTLLYSDSI